MITIHLNERRAALEDLVGVEAGDDHRGRPPKDEGRQQGQGDHDAPNADEIVDHDELRVAAAADDTRGHRHLIGRAKPRHAKDQKEIQGHPVGLRRQVGGDSGVQVHDGHPQKEQDGGCAQADAHEHELEGLGIRLNHVHPTAADSLADEHRRRRGRAHDGNLEHLVESGGDGIGSDGRARPVSCVHLAQNHRLEHDGAAEHEGGQQEGLHQLGVILGQKLVHAEEIPELPVQLFVDAQQVGQHDDQLHHPRRQSGDSRTRHAKAGGSQVALNEEIIQSAVDHQGGYRDPKADAHRLHAPQDGQEQVGEGKDQVGILHDLQVFHARRADHGIGGEHGDHGFGSDGRQCKQQQGKHGSQKQGAGGDALDGLGALLPPVLAPQHHRRVPRPQKELLEQELHLVHGADTRHGGLAVGTDHDVVGQIHAQGDDVEQHQHGPDRKEIFVKVFFFGYVDFCHK